MKPTRFFVLPLYDLFAALPRSLLLGTQSFKRKKNIHKQFVLLSKINKHILIYMLIFNLDFGVFLLLILFLLPFHGFLQSFELCSQERNCTPFFLIYYPFFPHFFRRFALTSSARWKYDRNAMMFFIFFGPYPFEKRIASKPLINVSYGTRVRDLWIVHRFPI